MPCYAPVVICSYEDIEWSPTIRCLQSFPLIWRFTDAEKYCQLTEEEFRRFRPLSVEDAAAKWAGYVYSGSDLHWYHLVGLLVRNQIPYPQVPTFQIGQEEEDAEVRVRANLRHHLPAADSAEALFFWGGRCAVRTDYGLLLDHWDDFCYPSDDSNVLVFLDQTKGVMYRDDRWYVLERAEGGVFFPPLGQ